MLSHNISYIYICMHTYIIVYEEKPVMMYEMQSDVLVKKLSKFIEMINNDDERVLLD